MPPVAWVTFEKSMQQAVWLLLFFVLAPILGPKPYGQFAIVMVFIGFCELVMVDAAVEALLGAEPLDPAHLRTANLVGLSLAALVGGGLFFAAPYIGRAFGDDGLAPLFRALAFLPAISMLTAAPLAILKRQLRFGPIALRSTFGLAVGGVCGVVLALRGAGVQALVAQILVQRIVEVVILWSSAHTRFGVGWSKSHFAELGRFAIQVFMARGLAFGGAQIPRLILGFFMGPVELGLFVFAARVPDVLIWTTIVPTTSVARITLRQHAPGDKALQHAFSRLVGDTALVAFPICCGAAAVMPLVFALALDARWQPAAFATQLLLLSVLPLVVYLSASSVLLAMRYPQDEARLSVAQIVSNTLCVLVAAPFGLNIVCFAMSIRHLLLMPVLLWILSRRCGITARSIALAIAPALAASLAMGSVVMLAGPLFELHLGDRAALPALILLGALVYGAMVAIVARRDAARIIAGFQRLAWRKRAATQ